MEGYSIDIVLFAPLAPILGVLLFWFIQLLFIQSEKYLIEKISHKHEPLCRFTNFLGLLFQTICHALGYTVTKSGISDFYLSVDYGKVSPKKERTGVFEWIANVFLFIGPFFIPAFLLFVSLIILKVEGLNLVIPTHIIGTEYSFGGQLTIFGASLYNFSEKFFGFLINIDLLHPGHFGFLLLLIFLGMGIRPNYIGEKKHEKIDMLYDLKNIWTLISFKPLYIIILFVIAYLFFHLSILINQFWYAELFTIFGWLSIISITALVIADALILLIKATDDISGKLRFIPFITLPSSYITLRVLFFYFPSDLTIVASLSIMILLTIFITFLLLKYKTKKFNTKTGMKPLRGKDDEEKKGKRRISRKRNN
jgi:hypothetical protein